MARDANAATRMYEEAAEDLRKEAEAGDVDSQFFIGRMYHAGRSMKMDLAKAVVWYRKSAEQGDARAQYYLGEMYREGKGVEKDEKEAMKWYRKAAEQGQADAQFKLGCAYFVGQGVPEDYAIKSSFPNAFLETLPQVVSKLKEPHPRGKKRSIDEVRKEAIAATVLILVY